MGAAPHPWKKRGFPLTKTWVFPKIVVPQHGWFIMENPIKMDDLGGSLIFGNTHIMFNLTFLRGVFLTPNACWKYLRLTLENSYPTGS